MEILGVGGGILLGVAAVGIRMAAESRGNGVAGRGLKFKTAAFTRVP